MATEKSWVACLYKLLLKYALPRIVLEKEKDFNMYCKVFFLLNLSPNFCFLSLLFESLVVMLLSKQHKFYRGHFVTQSFAN